MATIVETDQSYSIGNSLTSWGMARLQMETGRKKPGKSEIFYR